MTHIRFVEFNSSNLKFLDLSFIVAPSSLRERDAVKWTYYQSSASTPSDSVTSPSSSSSSSDFTSTSATLFQGNPRCSTSSFLQTSGGSVPLPKEYFFTLNTPHLTYLSLAYSLVSKTEEGKLEGSHCLSQIRKCERLEWLDLSGCTSLSTDSLEDLLRTLPRLQTLILQNTEGKELALAVRPTLFFLLPVPPFIILVHLFSSSSSSSSSSFRTSSISIESNPWWDS
jgi:hypothetical protein